VLAISGDTTQALAHYERALAIDQLIRALRNMGEVLLAAGRPREACERFEAAVRLRPSEVALTIGLVRCLAATDRVDDAIVVGKSALASAPRSADLRLALAGVLEQAGRSDEAAVRRREAAAIDPSVAGRAP
jgi:tetratricopeptide (TPR) repeat protein